MGKYDYVTERGKEGVKRRTTRWRKRNPEKWKEVWKAAHRRYWLKHRERILASKRLSRFGVSPEQYKIMLDGQGGKCALCLHVKLEGEKNFPIDHCHKTNKVRGILCHLCNRGLGHFKDDIAVLERAITYIRSHS